jgi:hypothetical protein
MQSNIYDRGPLLGEKQTVQLYDAYYWVHLAPVNERKPEYMQILEWYELHGKLAVLRAPYERNGKSIGRSTKTKKRNFPEVRQAIYRIDKSPYVYKDDKGHYVMGKRSHRKKLLAQNNKRDTKHDTKQSLREFQAIFSDYIDQHSNADATEDINARDLDLFRDIIDSFNNGTQTFAITPTLGSPSIQSSNMDWLSTQTSGEDVDFGLLENDNDIEDVHSNLLSLVTPTLKTPSIVPDFNLLATPNIQLTSASSLSVFQPVDVYSKYLSCNCVETAVFADSDKKKKPKKKKTDDDDFDDDEFDYEENEENELILASYPKRELSMYELMTDQEFEEAFKNDTDMIILNKKNQEYKLELHNDKNELETWMKETKKKLKAHEKKSLIKDEILPSRQAVYKKIDSVINVCAYDINVLKSYIKRVGISEN